MAASLITVFLTASFSYFLVVVRDACYRADLRIAIGHSKYGESIRIFAKVSNKGKAIARYVKPLLTLNEESLVPLVFAKKTKDDNWLNCHGDGYICSICDENHKNHRGFLCPEPFKVDEEYLCWSVAEVDADSGLFGKYYHVTNIPPNDAQRVNITDIYKSNKENICVVKFFSEYGTESKPRICLRLDLEKKTSLSFTLRLVGEGFNPIEEKFQLEISKDSLKIVFNDGRSVHISAFKELKEFPLKYHLVPAP